MVFLLWFLFLQTKQRRDRCWEQAATELTAQGVPDWTGPELRAQWSALVYRAKKYGDARNGTG